MAVFRKIHINTWRDGFFFRLPLLEKMFWLYLLTNEGTSASGVYELPIEVAARDLGVDAETVKKLLSGFEEKGRILYSAETEEVCILNWMRWNPPTSPTTRKCVLRELSEIKDPKIAEVVRDICAKLGYTLFTPKVEATPVEGVTPIKAEPNIKQFLEIYENGIGMANVVVLEELKLLAEEYSPEWFKEAVNEANIHNARTLAYVKAVLNRWKVHGKTTSKASKTSSKEIPNSTIYEIL